METQVASWIPSQCSTAGLARLDAKFQRLLKNNYRTEKADPVDGPFLRTDFKKPVFGVQGVQKKKGIVLCAEEKGLH